MLTSSYVRKHDSATIVFSTKPNVSPVQLAGRAKGRLDYELRRRAIQHKFSRKLSVRSIGDNTRQDVEGYITAQASHASFVDPRFEAFLEAFTVEFPSVNLHVPTPVSSGRYWYDLHLVLVTESRFRFVDEESLAKIRDQTISVARENGYLISRLSVMPDHLHVLLRGDIEHCPATIIGNFQNGIAMAFGSRIWKDTYYVGTVGEYNMRLIRRV